MDGKADISAEVSLLEKLVDAGVYLGPGLFLPVLVHLALVMVVGQATDDLRLRRILIWSLDARILSVDVFDTAGGSRRGVAEDRAGSGSAEPLQSSHLTSRDLKLDIVGVIWDNGSSSSRSMRSDGEEVRRRYEGRKAARE
jgi:hypothetical protein